MFNNRSGRIETQTIVFVIVIIVFAQFFLSDDDSPASSGGNEVIYAETGGAGGSGGGYRESFDSQGVGTRCYEVQIIVDTDMIDGLSVGSPSYTEPPPYKGEGVTVNYNSYIYIKYHDEEGNIHEIHRNNFCFDRGRTYYLDPNDLDIFKKMI